MTTSALPKPSTESNIETLRIAVGEIRKQVERLRAFTDPASRARLDEILEGGILNPNLNSTRIVSLLPVERTTGKDKVVKRISECCVEGHRCVPAHPDVFLGLLNLLSGAGEGGTDVRRSFLAGVRNILCLETTPVRGSGEVNIHCHQINAEPVEGQRPFSFDFMNGVQRIPGGIYHVLMMNEHE